MTNLPTSLPIPISYSTITTETTPLGALNCASPALIIMKKVKEYRETKRHKTFMTDTRNGLGGTATYKVL